MFFPASESLKELKHLPKSLKLPYFHTSSSSDSQYFRIFLSTKTSSFVSCTILSISPVSRILFKIFSFSPVASCPACFTLPLFHFDSFVHLPSHLSQNHFIRPLLNFFYSYSFTDRSDYFFSSFCVYGSYCDAIGIFSFPFYLDFKVFSIAFCVRNKSSKL